MINKDMIYKLLLEWQRDRYDDYLIMIDDCEDFYNYIVETLKAKDLMEELEIYNGYDLQKVLGRYDIYN